MRPLQQRGSSGSVSPQPTIAMADDHFPFVLLDMGRSGRTDEDFERFFATSKVIRERAKREKTRYVMIAMSQALLDARERKLVADYARTLPPEHTAGYVGCVLILPNGVMRGIITALTWLIPRLPPLAAVRAPDEAVRAAADLLRKHDIAYSPEQAAGAAKWLHARVAAAVPRALAGGG
jgi:hypothetical protein